MKGKGKLEMERHGLSDRYCTCRRRMFGYLSESSLSFSLQHTYMYNIHWYIHVYMYMYTCTCIYIHILTSFSFLRRGDAEFVQRDGVVALLWRDNQVVSLLSTHAQPQQ